MGHALGIGHDKQRHWILSATFVFFLEVLGRGASSSCSVRSCNHASFCSAHCSVQFPLKLVLHSSCPCGGVYSFSVIGGLLSEITLTYQAWRVLAVCVGATTACSGVMPVMVQRRSLFTLCRRKGIFLLGLGLMLRSRLTNGMGSLQPWGGIPKSRMLPGYTHLRDISAEDIAAGDGGDFDFDPWTCVV